MEMWVMDSVSNSSHLESAQTTELQLLRSKGGKNETNISSSKLAAAIWVKATVRFPEWSREARHSPEGLREDLSFWMSFLEAIFYLPTSQMFLSSKTLGFLFSFFFSLFSRDN